MDYSGLSGIFFFIQLAIWILVYQTVYHPIKEAESKLIGGKILVKIKRYLLRLIISEIKPLLNLLGIFTIFSLLGLVLSFVNKFGGAGLFFVILFTLLFSISLGEMIRYYYGFIIKRKNISEAKTTKEILKIFEVKKSYLDKLNKFINKAIDKKNPKENYLLNWALDGIYYYKQGKITEIDK